VPRAAAIRRSAASDRAGQIASTAAVSPSTPVQCSTRSHPAAIAAPGRSFDSPAIAPIARSSETSTPSKPIAPRITSPITFGESVAGRAASQAS
jgi:hypothetical protein